MGKIHNLFITIISQDLLVKKPQKARAVLAKVISVSISRQYTSAPAFGDSRDRIVVSVTSVGPKMPLRCILL